MAINKLNLNGTTYDIGEAAGTNTAESVVEFSSADEENPSSADESVALIKSGDTHKSLLEKISAGMKNIRYLLKQVTSLNSALAAKSNLISTQNITVDNISVTADTYAQGTTSVSRSGYTALGVLGFSTTNGSTSGANGSRCYLQRLWLTNSTTLGYTICNRNSSSDAVVALNVTILYVAN